MNQKKLTMTIDILRTAREIISDPEHWTKGVYARNASSVQVDTNSATAVRFCATGCIKRATGKVVAAAVNSNVDLTLINIVEDFPEVGYPHLWAIKELDSALSDCLEEHTLDRVVYYNDHPETTHADILALFDKAIEKLDNDAQGST